MKHLEDGAEMSGSCEQDGRPRKVAGRTGDEISILVQVAGTKDPQLGGLNHSNLLLTVLEAGRPESGCQRAPSPGCRRLTSCILTGQREGKGAPWHPLYKGTDPIPEDSTLVT